MAQAVPVARQSALLSAARLHGWLTASHCTVAIITGRGAPVWRVSLYLVDKLWPSRHNLEDTFTINTALSVSVCSHVTCITPLYTVYDTLTHHLSYPTDMP